MKWLFATGASGIVFSLYLGETKRCMAGRTFAVRMGLSVSPFILLQAEKSFNPSCERQVFLVFCRTLCNIL
jgi:hypothetical protein